MDDSPFGRLSGELRNHIYEYALTFNQVSLARGKWHRRTTGLALCTQLALAQVCRQIRTEALHLLFTLDDILVGPVPEPVWLLGGFSGWVTHSCEVVNGKDCALIREINEIPAYLRPESLVFKLEMSRWVQQLLKIHVSPGSTLPQRLHLWIQALCKTGSGLETFAAQWANLRAHLGQLMRGAHVSKLIIDFTPTRMEGPHPWCEAGGANPFELRRTLRYEMQVELIPEDSRAGRELVIDKFERARELLAKHERHDRTLCNIVKHGKVCLDRLEWLSHAASEVVQIWQDEYARVAESLIMSEPVTDSFSE